MRATEFRQRADFTSHMDDDLASLRRAQHLLCDKSIEEVAIELRLRFGVELVDAVASVAVATALTKRGVAIPDGRFALAGSQRRATIV